MTPVNEGAAELHRKLIKARAELDYLQKDGEYLEHGVKKYNFLSAEKIVHSVRDKLLSNGLSLLIDAESATELPAGTTKSGTTMNRVRICLKITVTDTDTGYSECARSYGDGFDVGDKAMPKAITVAFKYWLRMQLMIETGDQDPDKMHSPETIKLLAKMDTKDMTKEQVEETFDSYEFVKGDIALMRDAGCGTKREMVEYRSQFKNNEQMRSYNGF